MIESVKTFSHNTLPPIHLIRDESSGTRLYLTPEGNKYASVTSVVGFDKRDSLNEWRKSIGEEEANRISSRAAKRGTAIHNYCEDYLNNKKPNVNILDLELWKSYRPILDRIDNIKLIEGRMYSDKLKLAGTVDCVADFDGVLSILDFKTSRRLKTEQEIESYFLQTTAYACMVYERYGIAIKNIAILIAVDDNSPQIFIKNVGNYLNSLYDVIKRYNNQ